MASIKDSFLNDGAVSPRTRGEFVYNDSGVALAAGDLVYFSGWHEPALPDKPVRKVKKADADLLDAPAQAVIRSAIAIAGQGRAFATCRLTDLDTSTAGAAGDPVYLSVTAGGYTFTDPSVVGAGRKQIVGYVAVKSSTVGAIAFNVAEPAARGSASVTPQAVVNVAAAAAGALAAGNFGVPVVLPLTIAAGTTGNVDFTGLPFKCRVMNVTGVKTAAAGGGAGTLQVMNGATTDAITDAISIDVADKTEFEATTIDDAFWDLAAGATIRVVRTRTASTSEAAVLFLHLLRIV